MLATPTSAAPAPLTLTLHVTEQRAPAHEPAGEFDAPDAFEGSYCCYCCTCDFDSAPAERDPA